MLALHMTEVPAAAQGRPLAPIEARVLGVEHVLTPMARELRRRCTCVSAAFAQPRVPFNHGGRARVFRFALPTPSG